MILFKGLALFATGNSAWGRFPRPGKLGLSPFLFFWLLLPSESCAPGKRRAVCNPPALPLTALNSRFWTRPASRARTSITMPAANGWPRIPCLPAYPSWGRFNELAERNRELLHQILESAAANTQASPGSNEQKIGDFYASCMDEKQINAAGAKPLDAEFARIDAIQSTTELQEEIARLQGMGVRALFDFGSTQDEKNSSQVIGGADQGGLGLPDRDYYTKTDDKSKQIRQQYEEHVAKMLALAGDDGAKAASEAKAIVELETKLADASMTRVERRDPDKTLSQNEPRRSADADAQLVLGRLFSGNRLHEYRFRRRFRSEIFRDDEPGAQGNASRNLEDVSPLAPGEFDRAVLVRSVCEREFQFQRARFAGHQGIAAALEALRIRRQTASSARRSDRSMSRNIFRRRPRPARWKW